MLPDTAQPPGLRLYTKKELAQILRVTTRTVDNYVRRGMDFQPCGGAKRFELAAVLAWLARDAQARLRGEAPTHACLTHLEVLV